MRTRTCASILACVIGLALPGWIVHEATRRGDYEVVQEKPGEPGGPSK